jgi:hypothetical protein
MAAVGRRWPCAGLTAHRSAINLLLMRSRFLTTDVASALAECLTEAVPSAEPPPADLAPRTPFSRAVIAAGLPPAGRFSLADLRLPFAR